MYFLIFGAFWKSSLDTPMSTWYWLLHQSLDIAQNPEEICQSSGFLVKSSINKNRHNSGTKNDSVSS